MFYLVRIVTHTTQILHYLKLLLIRHAESIGNTQNRMEGQQSTPLSRLGQQQATHLSQALIASRHTQTASSSTLAQHNPPRIAQTLPTHLYSSPLLRATQTASALQQSLIRESCPLAIKQHPDLQEIHPGIFQGLTWTEASAQHPKLCKHLMNSLAWQPIPKAESLVEARSRAQGWIDQMLSQHQPGDVVWVVSHAGLMLHLIAVLMGCDRTWKITIPNTAIFEFWIANTNWNNLEQTLGPDRFNPEHWILRRFNDTAHLHDLRKV